MTLTVSSAPYQGEYTVQVVEVVKEGIVVTMPLRGQGLIVPLAAGESIMVKFSGGNYRGQVLNRNFGKLHTLTISAPGAISLMGREESHGARFIAVTSGKGGVGKSTVSLNLSLALVALGLRVCMVDVDLGTANLDLMLGIAVPADLGDLLESKSLDEVLVPVTHGLTLLPGSSGVGEIANLNNWQMSRLVTSFNQLSDDYDIVILDTGAGVSTNVTAFLQAADQVLLVITPDPTAITDAYALLKVAKTKGELHSPWQLIQRQRGGSDSDQFLPDRLSSSGSPGYLSGQYSR
jgi:flagellar biosynthesis protein FlhG